MARTMSVRIKFCDQVQCLREGREGVLHKLNELSLEPASRNRCACQCAGQVIAIQLIAGVSWVAHSVKSFAAGVRRADRDEETGAVGLSRRLDPDERIDTC